MAHPEWYVKLLGGPEKAAVIARYRAKMTHPFEENGLRGKVTTEHGKDSICSIESTKFIVTIVGSIPNEPTVEVFLASAASGATWSIGFFSRVRTRGHVKQLPLRTLPEAIDTPRKAMLFALEVFQNAPKELESEKPYLCRHVAEFALSYFGSGTAGVDLDAIFQEVTRQLVEGSRQELDRDQVIQQLEQISPRPTPILDKLSAPERDMM